MKALILAATYAVDSADRSARNLWTYLTARSLGDAQRLERAARLLLTVGNCETCVVIECHE